MKNKLTKPLKKLVFLLAVYTLSSCAEANFDVTIESDKPECIISQIDTTKELKLKLDLYAQPNNGKFKIYQNRKLIGKIIGKTKDHPLDLKYSKGLEFPNFFIFTSDQCDFILEQRKMNDKLFIVNEERVSSYYQKRINSK